MNSKQRRQEKRRWLKENKDEIEALIAWIKSPIIFEPMPTETGDIIDCRPINIEKRAFKGRYAWSRKYWKEFLIKKGVPEERFISTSKS